MTTRQEILEAVTRHRANPALGAIPSEVERKFSEIEWALQALAEELCADKAEAVTATHKEEEPHKETHKGKKKYG